MEQQPSAKALAIIVATYNQGDYVLRSLVYGLLSQSSGDYRCYVIHDGPSVDSTKEFMEEIIDKYPDLFVYLETEKREALWGHPSRQLGLNVCTEPYVTFTNADNLYFKDYVSTVTDFIRSSAVDVYTVPIIHNYFEYRVFTGDGFGLCKSDFMNVVLRTSLAKQIPIQVKQYAADGYLFEDFRKKFPGFISKPIPHILGVHQ